jgi:hypothetical protein
MLFNNTSRAGAIYANYPVSGFPSWTTGTYTNTGFANVFVQLLASGDAPLTYALQSGSSLPANVTLSSSGLLSGTNANAGVYSFTVIVDDVQKQSTQQAITLTISSGGDANFKYNVLLLSADGTNNANNHSFVDSSTNNFPITRVGNSTQGTFSPYGANWSTYVYSGNLWQINYASNSTIASDFTVELWVYDLGTTAYGTPFGWRNGSSSWSGISFQRNNGANNLLASWANGSTPVNIIQTNGTYLPNQWNHVAIVRSGTTATVYVNGVNVGTATWSGSFDPGSSLWLGSDPYNNISATQLSGYISNVRFVNGTAIYTSAFTPPTMPLTPVTNTGLLVFQSPTVVNNGPYNFTITNTSAATIQRFSPFSPVTQTPQTYSGLFNGSSDYLTWSGTTVGTGAMTFECWFYYTGSFGAIAAFIGPGSAITGGLNCYIENSTSLTFDRYGVAGSTYTVPTIVANTWNHVAFVRNSSNVATVFFNGVRSSTGTTSDTYSYTTSAAIGWCGGAVPRHFAGYISNARLVVGSNVYDPTQSTITVPTTPLTAITNTKLLTCQDATFKDNSTNAFAITATGSPAPRAFNPFGFTSATTQGYTVSTIGGSGYFDGTGDYLSIPASSAQFSPGTNNLTVEGWFYFTNLSAGVQNLFGINNGSGTVQKLMAYVESNGTIHFDITQAGGASQATSAAGAVVNNTWYHFAFVRNAGTAYIYVNGVSVASGAATGNLSALTNPFYIGYIGEGYGVLISGYISNFRYVNGTAVYTSNFVPPSAPVTAITNTQLLTNFTNAGIYDATMQNVLETVGDAKISTTQSKFGGSSMFFDGTGDYLTIPTSPNLQFGTGDFTLELWTYFISRSVGGSCFINNYNNYAAGSLGIFAGHAGGNTSKYQVSYNGSSFPSIQSSISIIYNQWAHLALVRSGTTITLYINGVADGTITSASAALNGVGSTWFIGTAGDSIANYYVNGYIDDLRITKGFARYTANFTPPTATLEIL